MLLTDDLPLKSDPNLKAPVFLRLAQHNERWLIETLETIGPPSVFFRRAQHDEPWLIERIDARLEEPFTRRLTNLLRDAD